METVPTPSPAVAATVPGTYVALDPRRLEKSNNPRRQVVPASYITEIAASMRKHGVLEPLIVRPTKTGGHQVVAGDTRQKAAVEADLPLVPCIVRDLNDLDMLEVQLIENVQRNSMHPVDEGEAFKRLIDGRKYTPETLAKTMGKSLRWVYNRLEFTKLIPKVRQAFLDAEITATHAELLARLEAADQELAYKDGLFHELFGETKGEKRHAVSVKELNDWIEQHVRLNVRTDAVQRLIPEVEELVDEVDRAARDDEGGAAGGRILQVSHDYMLPGDPKLRKQLAGVLFERHWKPAESTKQRCEFAEKAVIVFGRNQGDVLLVCANKKCAKHFPEHTPEAKAKRAKQAARQTSGGETRNDYAAKLKREDEERDRRRARWNKLQPALKAATFAALDNLKAVSSSMLVAALKAHQFPEVRVQLLPAMLVRQAITDVYRNSWYDDEPKAAAWAKQLGVDVKAIERATFPPATAAKGVTDPKDLKAVKKTIDRRHAKKAAKPQTKKKAPAGWLSGRKPVAKRKAGKKR